LDVVDLQEILNNSPLKLKVISNSDKVSPGEKTVPFLRAKMSRHSFDGLETQRLGRPAMKSIKLYKIATAPAIPRFFFFGGGGQINLIKKHKKNKT